MSENNKSDIIIYAIIIITAIIAVVIGLKLGIRLKTVFYLLVILEALIYYVAKAIIDKFK